MHNDATRVVTKLLIIKFKTINTLSVLMLLTGLALAIFGYWGLCTKAGNEVYPEMAGLIPFYSLLASLPFLLLAGIRGFISYRKTKAKALIVKKV